LWKAQYFNQMVRTVLIQDQMITNLQQGILIKSDLFHGILIRHFAT